MHYVYDFSRRKSHQDTKPSSDDELAAIRLEGKVINTEKAKMMETNFFIFILTFTYFFVYCI